MTVQVDAHRPLRLEKTVLPRLVWRDHDHVPWLAIGAAAGVALGGVFAVFGLPNVSTMDLLYSRGIVTPSCGLTRSVSSIAAGNFGLAWRFNPAGFLIVGLLAFAILRWVFGRLTNRWPGVVITDWRVPVAAVVLGTIALWINQQANADFIINARL